MGDDRRDDRWHRVEDIFHAALEHDEAHRAEFLDAACIGDAALRDEIESLLASHGRAAAFIEVPVSLLCDDDQAITPPTRDLTGTTLGHYNVGGRIGQGGMGVVYSATDTRLGRTVALKVLAQHLTRDDERRQRLWREARAAAALSHPGIATIYAVEEFDDEIVLVSEYVRGHTLREELAAGALPMDRVIKIGLEMARALAAAHDSGVIHRDLKPENVMRAADGRVKILDFGLALVVDEHRDAASRITRAGVLLGTPAYMSPEQLRGQDVDARTDQFSLGVMLHELATARLPFDGDGRGSPFVTESATSAEPRESLPSPLAAIIRRCLEDDRSRRFASMHDLAAALDALADQSVDQRQTSSSPAHRPAPSPPLWWWRCHQALTCAAYVALVAGLWPTRHVLAGRAGPLVFCTALVAALTSIALRLHLWFTSRVYPSEWRRQRARAAHWIVGADVLFASVIAAVAATLLDRHEAIAALLLATAVSVIIASLLIEPATTRVAFGEDESGQETYGEGQK